jgi:hypothetical protein
MKKIITVLAFALICSGAFAQFNQGRYLVGGSLGFSTTTSKSKTDNSTNTQSHSTSFFLSPNVGYFVIDNLAVGAGLGLSVGTSKGDGNNTSKNTSTSVTLSPFVRYYLDQGIFFQGQVGFGSSSNKYKETGSNTTITTKNGVFNWALAAGYAYFLNDFVAVEPMVGFRSQSSKNKDLDVKSINSGIFLNVGLQVYLGPRD